MSNLPIQPTPFVGRRRELAEIEELLADTACRLLTLLGAGGAGKTRLALATAERQTSHWSDGVVFVPLQGLQDAGELVSTVADSLQIQFHGAGEATTQLAERLRERQLLLVLDNLEHLLIDSGAEAVVNLLSSLLRIAAGVKIIVTSRAALNIQQEWVFPVQGLHFEDGANGVAGDAVDLFVDRARHARTDFSLTQQQFGVKRICQLVEGSPLAMELAAGWTTALSCREIADQIERDVGFLVSQQRNAPTRHASMQAVFDQSWSHLADEEKRVLRRMSVFRDGCRLDAAQNVAGATLPVLAALIGKSLLRRTADDRYELHELLRQYAAEQLERDPDDQLATCRRHMEHYLTLLKELTPDMQGSRQIAAHGTLNQELQNLLAAWRWAVATGDLIALTNAAEGLIHFCEISGRFHDGASAFRLATDHFERLRLVDKESTAPIDTLRHPIGQHSRLRVEMQTGLGMCMLRLGQLAEAQRLLEQCVATLRAMQPEAAGLLAFALHWHGHVYLFQGRYALAQQTFLESLTIYRVLQDSWGIGASAYLTSAVLRYQGVYAEAERYLTVSEEMLRPLGEQRLFAFCISDRGIFYYQRGDYPRAEHDLLEALAIRRGLHDLWSIGYSTRELGYVFTAVGNYPEAKNYLEESLAAFEEVGATNATIFPLDALGTLARAQGNFAQAESFYRQALAASVDIREQRGEALCRYDLGCLALLQDDARSAAELMRRSLELYGEIGHRAGIGFASSCLGGTVGVEIDRRARGSSPLRPRTGHRGRPRRDSSCP